MRIPFSRMFEDDGHGSYTPKHRFTVDGVTLGKETHLTPGVLNCGVDIANYVDHDLEIEQHEGGTPQIESTY